MALLLLEPFCSPTNAVSKEALRMLGAIKTLKVCIKLLKNSFKEMVRIYVIEKV
jgi:hypothetical protein